MEVPLRFIEGSMRVHQRFIEGFVKVHRRFVEGFVKIHRRFIAVSSKAPTTLDLYSHFQFILVCFSWSLVVRILIGSLHDKLAFSLIDFRIIRSA